MRLALCEARPDKNHRRAGRSGEKDQSGDVRVDLIGGKGVAKQAADENPAQQRHRKGFDRPVNEQGHADAAPVAANLFQRREIDPHQHGNDHQPDEQGDRQIHFCDFKRGDGVEKLREEMAEYDARDNAERDPDGKIAFEKRHLFTPCGSMAVSRHPDRRSRADAPQAHMCREYAAEARKTVRCGF